MPAPLPDVGDRIAKLLARAGVASRREIERMIAEGRVALGGKVEVPTLGGSVTINIPANARNGQKLRLRERGLPGLPPGDQLVVLRIVNPPVETEAARALFERMAQELPFDPRMHWGQ